MKQNLDKKWVVVQIKPHSHDLAFRNLERQGFEIFAPKMKVTRRKQKIFIDKDVFVFPGYMFVGIGLQNSILTKINSTYGVSKLLVFNNKPCKIPNDMILELKNRFETNTNPISEDELKKGDIIKFNSGPFVDLMARIEAVEGQNRIWVLLEALGDYKRLKIQQTEKIKFTKI